MNWNDAVGSLFGRCKRQSKHLSDWMPVSLSRPSSGRQLLWLLLFSTLPWIRVIENSLIFFAPSPTAPALLFWYLLFLPRKEERNVCCGGEEKKNLDKHFTSKQFYSTHTHPLAFAQMFTCVWESALNAWIHAEKWSGIVAGVYWGCCCWAISVETKSTLQGYFHASFFCPFTLLSLPLMCGCGWISANVNVFVFVR